MVLLSNSLNFSAINGAKESDLAPEAKTLKKFLILYSRYKYRKRFLPPFVAPHRPLFPVYSGKRRKNTKKNAKTWQKCRKKLFFLLFPKKIVLIFNLVYCLFA
jgi:hypothetical protein